MRFLAQVIKELLSNLRNPQTRLSLIGPPLLQLFVLSFAATLEVRNVDIAIVDDDGGRASHELIARIGAADFIDDVVVVDRQEEIAQMLDRRQILAGLRFAADFSRDVAAHRPASVQVLIDGRRANAGQVALSYLDSIASDYGVELAGPQAVAMPLTPTRHWFNPNLTYTWFIVPAMTAVLVMFNSLVITGLSIPRERELGTFDQLLVSPVSPFEIVMSKSVPAFIISTVQACLMIAMCVLAFRIPLAGSLTLLLLSMLLFILSMVGIGMMLSSICSTQQQAILAVFAIGYPLIMISGFATPVANMPHWLQLIAQASPLKHFLVIIQGGFVKAMPPADMLANAWPMAVIAAVTSLSATVIVKRRLQ
jgi:ABC-2 type transport system permease protein